MNHVLLMKNTVQDYAWGSRTAIAEIIGQPAPSPMPQAELWMGAHPKASSQVMYQGRWQPLNRLIDRYPRELLGPQVNREFTGELPFLLKVLAADQPLSIQAHPDKTQAMAGFARENQLGIPLDAPHRNYKDNRHKPECLCAVTPFWGLCGFRAAEEMMGLLSQVWPGTDKEGLVVLEKSGIQDFFKYLMTLPGRQRDALVGHVVKNAGVIEQPAQVPLWIDRLSATHGNDIGVLSPLILNLVKLSPGQAIFLPAGQLHAYLSGVGIELMANSDNVLRGGLTPKHVDVPELLNILNFAPFRPVVWSGAYRGVLERAYASPAPEFVLANVQVAGGRSYSPKDRSSAPEILLCTDGRAEMLWNGGKDALVLDKGRSAFVPAALDNYAIRGNATLYRASVNLAPDHAS